MIYLKMTTGDKISLSIERKKRRDLPEAMYVNVSDRIVILKLDDYFPDAIRIINHEFMHKILWKNDLKTASEKWDCGFIIEKVEAWLGWWDLLPGEMLIRKICKFAGLSCLFFK